jgi:hypothetical protein
VGLIADGENVYAFEKLDAVTLKGFTRPITVFAVNVRSA